MRLSQTSPAIDQGTSDTTGLNLPQLDMDGHRRLVGQIDLGSFENPFSNCPQNIQITDLYSPMNGTYRASQSIELSMGAHMASPNQAILIAPKVEIYWETNIEKGTTLDISLDTCQE